MAAIINFGTLLGEAMETALVHGLVSEAREWLLRRVYRDSGRRHDLQRVFHPSGIADDWMLSLQWDWIGSLPPGDMPPGELERMCALQETSERHVATAVERGEPLLWCRPFPEMQLVADWLASLPTDDPDMLRKLDRMSWDEAVALTERWHARLAKRMSLKTSAAELAEGTRAVLELPDGWRWVRLETVEALDREGDAMGHCVGQGGYDCHCVSLEGYDWLLFPRSSRAEGIYSLRDARGMPHVTVEVTDGKVRQALGKANAVPSGHAEPLAALVTALGVGIGDGMPGLFGMARVSERLMPVADALALLAAGPIDGDVDLGGCDVAALPEGLSVVGCLFLTGCPSLTTLPESLSVGGSIDLSGCTALTSLPCGLSVAGDLYLNDCTALSELPEGLSVGDWLFLTGCTSLTTLPEGLSVGGSIELSGCSSLAELPWELSVEGNLYLSGCTSLRSLPDDLTVGGWIYGADHLGARLHQRRGMRM